MDEHLTRRLDSLEDGLVLLLLERYGGAGVDTAGLRDSVRSELSSLAGEVRERLRNRMEDSRVLCQFTGANREDVVQFCGSSATVREDESAPTVLWIIAGGNSQRIRAGTWLERDRAGRILVTKSPVEATA